MNRTFLTLLCLLIISLPLSAALPDYYPQTFQSWGKLNRLDSGRHFIIIGDDALRLSPQVKVYTKHTRFGTLDQLRVGMTIGVQASGHSATVTEVWVLPAGYRPKAKSLPLQKINTP